MTKCKDCGVDIVSGKPFAVRCKRCRGKNTVKRKYKRRHEFRTGFLRKRLGDVRL